MAQEFASSEPAPGNDVTTVTFRVPSGLKIQRRFLQTDTIDSLYKFIETKREEEATGFEDKKA